MFLVDLLRLVFGYIVFRGQGGFSERFINLCSVHDIPLWNVNYQKDSFTACTTVKGYFKIAIACKNSGVRVKRIKKIGLPFTANRLKPRIGLLIGTTLMAIVFFLLSSKLWRIEINGNSTVPTDIILAQAESCGLKIGMDLKDVNAPQISLDICKNIDSLSWAAIKITGNCVYIDITERSSDPKTQKDERYCNIVASKDAQLISLEPYRGTVLAKVYNPVLKGEVLISSAVQGRDENVYFVHASGYAVGRTETTFSKATATEKKCIAYNLIRRTYEISFFGINIPLGFTPKDFDQKITFSNFISFKKKVIPIGIKCNEYGDLSNKNQEITSENANKISISNLMQEIFDFCRDKEIIESEIKIDNKSHTATAELICHESIGIEAPIEIEQTAQP